MTLRHDSRHSELMHVAAQRQTAHHCGCVAAGRSWQSWAAVSLRPPRDGDVACILSSVVMQLAGLGIIELDPASSIRREYRSFHGVGCLCEICRLTQLPACPVSIRVQRACRERWEGAHKGAQETGAPCRRVARAQLSLT